MTDFSEKLIKSEHKYSGIIVDVRVDIVSLPNGNNDYTAVNARQKEGD